MPFRSEDTCLEALPVFKVLLPTQDHDEFQLHEAISQADKSEEVLEGMENLFKTPSLDLASLVQQKRASHLDLSTEDTSSVQSYTEECKQDVLSLQAKATGLISKIASLCNELSEVTARLHQKADQRDLCQYVLTPIRCIHQDLLEPIFLACLDLEQTNEPSNPKMPLQLAAVCHRWRQIAHATPALWSRLFIDEKTPHHFGLAKLWLSRCQFPSLTIHVPMESSLEHVFNLLAANDQRPAVQIRRLELLSSSQKTLSTLLDGHSDELEEIAIKYSSSHSLQNVIIPASVKRLYIDDAPLSWFRSPPHQLAILRITDEIPCEMLDLILSECTVLQKLYVCMAGDSLHIDDVVEGVALNTPITCRHLTYLGLSYDVAEEPFHKNLLAAFNFPALNIFEIYLERPEDSDELETLDWLVSLPFLPQLKRLSLRLEFEVPQSYYDTLFRVSGSLEELSIYLELQVDPNTQVFKALMANASSVDIPARLPLLKNLHFFSDDSLIFTSSKIAQVGKTWTSNIASDTLPELLQPRTLSVHTYRDTSHADKLFNDLQETCPNLGVVLTRRKFPNWLEGVVPFEMHPLAFNEVNSYEVMKKPGVWVPKVGPIHHIL